MIALQSDAKTVSIELEDEKNAVLDQLAEVVPVIYACVHYGNDLFSQRHNEHILELSKTTRSNIIRDYVVNRAKELLGENLKVRFVEVNRMLLMVVGDRIAIRFKKLTKRKKSLNIPTGQVQSWRNGTLSIPELSIARVKCIDVGYVTNSIGTGIASVWAVALGDKPWFFNMTEKLGEVVPTLFMEEELPEENPFSIKPSAKRKEQHGKQAS